jgi:hypothetical protein
VRRSISRKTRIQDLFDFNISCEHRRKHRIQERSVSFENDLTGATSHLIDDIRAEASTPLLPVVGMQIGVWAHSMPCGATVYDAQAKRQQKPTLRQ